MGKTILVMEPDSAILRLIQILLSEEDYQVTLGASDARNEASRFDLVLIDIAPPYEEHLGTLASIRNAKAVPIIAMSATTNEEVKHAALKRGADDFLASPFDPDELISHVRFLLGEQTYVTSHRKPLVSGTLQIDFKRRTMQLHDVPVTLSYSEWVILESLASPPGQPCLMAELLGKTWGAGFRTDHEFLRTCVQRLQRKLGCDPRDPRLIKPYHDVGYILSL